jgi:hypothetical protein
VEVLAPLTVHTHLGNGRVRDAAFVATRQGPDDAAVYADDVRFAGAWLDARGR